MIYIAYLFVLVILLLAERSAKSSNNIYRILIIAIYTILIGFRGRSVGVDTDNYYDHYYTYGLDGNPFVEPGFDWLNQFCYHQGWSQAPFFVICALFAILPVFLCLRKSSGTEFSIFALLFCTTTFVSLCNGMRQNMACGIVFAGIYIASLDNLKKGVSVLFYISMTLFAALFHATALFLMPFFLLRDVKLKPIIWIVIYLLSFIFIFENISYLFPEITIVERDYSGYLIGNMADSKASSLGFLVTTLKNVTLLAIMCICKTFDRHRLFSNMVMVSLILTNLGFNVPIIGRINMYFSWFSILIIAIVFSEYKREEVSINNIYFVVLFLVIAVLSIHAFLSPANKLLPYTFLS